MAKLRNDESIVARALEFTILTAARSDETRRARWDEINWDEGVWTVPAHRMKKRVETAPPQQAGAGSTASPAEGCVRADLPRRQRRTANWLQTLLLKIQSLWPGATVHGCRSSFMDWAHERTSATKVVIDQSLAHKIKDPTEAAYRRGDLLEKRRKLMEQWSGYLAAPAVSGKVERLYG